MSASSRTWPNVTFIHEGILSVGDNVALLLNHSALGYSLGTFELHGLNPVDLLTWLPWYLIIYLYCHDD